MKIPQHKKPFRNRAEFDDYTRRKQSKLNQNWITKEKVLDDRMKKSKKEMEERVKELERRISNNLYDYPPQKKEDEEEVKSLKFKLKEMNQQKTLV